MMNTEPTYHGFTIPDAIDALKAHDNGATDSGIDDEDMRDWVIGQLGPNSPMTDAEHRRVLAEMARGLLADEAVQRGYGLEDVARLIEWLREHQCL